jgi:predicted AAA+ superfamily ATPase
MFMLMSFKTREACSLLGYPLPASCLLALLFAIEDGHEILLRNIRKFLPGNMASHPKIQ